MAGLTIGCVFDVHFSDQAISAEKIMSAIIGKISYQDIRKLPALDIPDFIRKQNVEFKKEPLYELFSAENPTYKVILGDGLLGIAIVKTYQGWEGFKTQLEELYQALLESKIRNSFERIGLREISFYKGENIFGGREIFKEYREGEKHYLTTERQIDDFNCIEIMTNNAMYNGDTGSILDLTVSHNSPSLEGKDGVLELVEKMHKHIEQDRR